VGNLPPTRERSRPSAGLLHDLANLPSMTISTGLNPVVKCFYTGPFKHAYIDLLCLSDNSWSIILGLKFVELHKWIFLLPIVLVNSENCLLTVAKVYSILPIFRRKKCPMNCAKGVKNPGVMPG
jgi:hypothetical protein